MGNIRRDEAALSHRMEDVMKSLFSVTATAALMLGGSGAAAAELPTFQLMGFPITAHQFSVVGSAGVRELSPIPTFTLAGMPASPHQVAVLTPRPKVTEQQIAERLTKAGLSQIRFVAPSEYTVMAFRNGRWTRLIVDSITGQLR
jgi:hypothetical protein